MNNNFFQFTERPFQKTPATKNYFENKNLIGLLNAFTDFIRNDSAFATLTGLDGTGKTSFANYLMSKKTDLAKFIYLQFPFLSTDELIIKLIEELRPNNNSKEPEGEAVNKYKLVNECLLNMYNQKCKVVFIIDEAQSLSPATFEVLRVLSTLVYNNTHLIKIILIGKNNLLKQLDNNGLDGITQKISLYAMLDNLPLTDVQKYIKAELDVSGSSKINISTSLIKKVAKLSNGNPQLINIYMERAITTAEIASSNNVTLKHLNTGLKACNYIVPANSQTGFAKRILFDLVFVVLMFIILTVSYNYIIKYNILHSIISQPQNYINTYKTPEVIQAPTVITPPTVTPIEPPAVIIPTTPPPIPEPEPKVEAPAANKTLKAIINARSLNVRSEPNTTATVITSYKLGDEVNVTDFNDEWAKTEVNGKTGYMMKTYLDIKK